MRRFAMFFFSTSAVLAALSAFAAAADEVASKAGDVLIVVRPTALQRATNSRPLTPGTSLIVVADDGRAVEQIGTHGILVLAGCVGRVDRAAVIPLAEANDYFTAAIEKNPADATALLGRGKVWFHFNNVDKTIPDLDESLRLAPNSEALTIRGWAWKRKGDKAKAMADFDEAIRLDPHNALAWRVRGATWAGKGDYPQALAQYTESIRLDPENPDSLLHRANLLAACNDAAIRNGEQAVADATRACELSEWKSPLYLGTLSVACAERGDFAAALKWNAKAMEMATPEHRGYLTEHRQLFENKQPKRMTWK